jgi:hypothetical protein
MSKRLCIFLAGFVTACNLSTESHSHSTDMSCLLTNHKLIGLALSMYVTEHEGRLPESLLDLSKEGYLTDPSLRKCPAHNKDERSVDYEMEELPQKEGNELVAILYDKPGNHRIPGRFVSVLVREIRQGGQAYYLEKLGFAAEEQLPIVLDDLRHDRCLDIEKWRTLLRWDL